MRILHPFDFDNFFHKAREKALLILDYDGTLAPFKEERMEAYPYPGVKERLFAFAELKHIRTIIVSGRSLSDLEVLLLDGLLHLELWGSHGLERKFPTGEVSHAVFDAKLQEGLDLGIKACLENIDQKHCEIKPYAVALHWRGMDPTEKLQERNSINKRWEEISSKYEFEIHPFDGGIELRPKGQTKGDTVRELLKEVPPETAIAYFGDDITDEDAFRALADRGLKVLVRKEFRPTLADIQVIPPEELLSFLDRWKSNE